LRSFLQKANPRAFCISFPFFKGECHGPFYVLSFLKKEGIPVALVFNKECYGRFCVLSFLKEKRAPLFLSSKGKPTGFSMLFLFCPESGPPWLIVRFRLNPSVHKSGPLSVPRRRLRRPFRGLGCRCVLSADKRLYEEPLLICYRNSRGDSKQMSHRDSHHLCRYPQRAARPHRRRKPKQGGGMQRLVALSLGVATVALTLQRGRGLQGLLAAVAGLRPRRQRQITAPSA